MWFPLPAVEIVVVCTFSSCSSEVDALDGAAKGDSESGDNTDVWVREKSISAFQDCSHPSLRET